MKTNEIVHTILDYYIKERGYKERESEGLFIPAFPNSFNPSTATSQVIELINQKEFIKPAYHFALIDRCSRHLDWERCGFGTYLSFFEMISAMNAAASYLYKAKEIKEMLFNEAFSLFERLGIKKKKLLITVFAGGSISGEYIEPDIESNEILEKLEIQVIEMPGTSNFYYPQYDRHPGGLRIEVFYDRGEERTQDRWVEIATFVLDYCFFGKSKHRLVHSRNIIWGTAFGIERLAMVVQGRETIYETDVLVPIVEIIENKIRQDKNDILLQISRREINLVADYLKAIVFIIADSEKVNLGNNQRQMLTKLIRRIFALGRNLNIREPDFYFLLIDRIITLYHERYPYLTAQRDRIRQALTSDYNLEP